MKTTKPVIEKEYLSCIWKAKVFSKYQISLMKRKIIKSKNGKTRLFKDN